jgi:hypothetical protein
LRNNINNIISFGISQISFSFGRIIISLSALWSMITTLSTNKTYAFSFKIVGINNTGNKVILLLLWSALLVSHLLFVALFCTMFARATNDFAFDALISLLLVSSIMMWVIKSAYGNCFCLCFSWFL